MTGEPDLKAAYALRGKDDVRRLYGDWAETYDSGFSDAQGYLMPRETARMLQQAGGQGPVLDVGAGTGLVGAELAARGIGPVDGIDLSPEMLAVARAKGQYRRLIEADITRPLTGLPPYASVISAGTFTLGHVGPEGISPLLDLGRAGTLFVIGINAAHYTSAGFSGLAKALADRITGLTLTDIRIYDDRADAAHRHDMARVMLFRLA